MHMNRVINKHQKVFNIIINKKILKKINYSFGYGIKYIYIIYILVVGKKNSVNVCRSVL